MNGDHLKIKSRLYWQQSKKIKWFQFKFFHSRSCIKVFSWISSQLYKNLFTNPSRYTHQTRRTCTKVLWAELKRDAEGGGLNSHTEREMSSLRNDEWKSFTMINYCKRTRPLYASDSKRADLPGKTQVNQENHHIMGFCGWVGWWKKGLTTTDNWIIAIICKWWWLLCGEWAGSFEKCYKFWVILFNASQKLLSL